MPPIKHALLGASSAKRWMTCPPSARWEAELPEPEERDYTREGTLAHALSEAKLTQFLTGEDTPSVFREEHEYDPLYNEAMENHTDRYVDRVVSIYEGYELAGRDPHMYLEQRLDFSRWVPEGFGTGDVVIVADGILHIIDLKYGKGVPVDAVGNPQIRLYALGAWVAFQALEDIHTVTMEIIQPRLDSDTEETMTLDELLLWAREVLAPAADLAWKGEGPFTPSEEGCRFCRGRHLCRYNAAYQLELGRLDMKQGPELTKLEIAGILERVDGLAKWATSLKEWALEQAVNHGQKFPGYKLVEGRSNRVITDKAAAAARLEANGFGPEKVMELKGMTDLEKAVGKKKLAELLGELVIKPEGRPTLVRETDKRPEIDLSAKVDDYFKD